ncbi:preprotein translocase subunit SecY [Patescibacteria group bacterium]
MNTLIRIFKDPDLRRKILAVMGFLFIFRIAAAIPIPGIDLNKLSDFFAGNQFFGLLNIFSGGSLDNLSIVMLGVAPYITASIIMQLLTMIFPQLKTLYHEEGETGRKKFYQIARYLTVPLAILQGYALITLLIKQGVVDPMPFFTLATNVLIVTAGSVFLMWIGELITEFGIGNGVSLLIFAGIVAGIPMALRQTIFTIDPSRIPIVVGFLFSAVVIIGAVVFITEGERPIPISYAKRVRGTRMYGGSSTYLPLRVNQAGVIPIIFAISILLFPQMIVSFIAGSQNLFLQRFSEITMNLFNNTWFYGFLYFMLVFLFTYFYTSVTFDPDAISTNLQKSGGFIPGMRPGAPTSAFLSYVINRLTLVGGLFLGAVAVLPIVVQGFTGAAFLTIGGTALLIAVSVVLETIKQIKAQLTMRDYE